MQGVIKAYDPGTKTGVVVSDSEMVDGSFREFELADDALDNSIFRMVRQGQRVVFDIVDGFATNVHFGSEADMATPGFSETALAAEPAPDRR